MVTVVNNHDAGCIMVTFGLDAEHDTLAKKLAVTALNINRMYKA